MIKIILLFIFRFLTAKNSKIITINPSDNLCFWKGLGGFLIGSKTGNKYKIIDSSNESSVR